MVKALAEEVLLGKAQRQDPYHCNGEEQILLHVGSFFFFNFCMLLLLLQVKNVAYCLKYTRQPILKVLIFKIITLSHS